MLYTTHQRSDLRILMVISEAPPVRSGIARVAERLSSGLHGRGHTVDLLSIHDIPRLELGEVRLSSMIFHLPKLRARINHYDIVHLHGPVPTFSDVFLLSGLNRRRHPPIVYTYHAPIDLRHFPFRLASRIYNVAQERLARLADHVVVTTPAYHDRLGRFVPRDKLSVIPWGVDFDRFVASPERPDPFTVLFLGQLRPYKGLPVLLKAFAGLKDARLWVVGDGHQAQHSRELAAQLGLENVTFWGSLPDDEIIRRLHEAHALVLPSVTRSEAFGLVLLEAMAAGCLPVASRLPGVADVAGPAGLTFEPGDSQALRAILQDLQERPEWRLAKAELAQEWARLYNWERVAAGYAAIFRRLAARAKPAGLSVWPEAVRVGRMAGD